MKKIAAYCRVSTSSYDQLLSLQAQKEHYTSFISKCKDWQLVGVYYDEGISGLKKETRSGLKQMMEDAENGLIDKIITKSISRFSRNTIDCLELVRKLKEWNVYILFEKENIDTESMDGELMLTILSSLAQDESLSISENEKWSIQKRFKDGTYIISYPPYGYKYVEKVMTIVNSGTIIVKEIFELALKYPTTQIAKNLNLKGIKSIKSRR